LRRAVFCLLHDRSRRQDPVAAASPGTRTATRS
jgi:hypothetical protein